MAKDINELLAEGKEFADLLRENDNMRWPDSGTTTYIIADKWLDKYKDFVCYSDIKRGKTPSPKSSHLTDSHPGKIQNTQILIQDPAYVRGTGKLKDFPIEVYDTFLERKVREGSDYHFITEKLWNFLKERYGVD